MKIHDENTDAIVCSSSRKDLLMFGWINIYHIALILQNASVCSAS